MASAPDPAALFREMLGQWERTSNEIANKLMGTGEFSRSMNAATALSLKLQQAMQEQMSRFLAAANMPSREEVAELGTLLRAIDARLARIEATLGTPTGAAPAHEHSRPPRTRKPARKADQP